MRVVGVDASPSMLRLLADKPGADAEAQAQAICMAHPDFRTAYDANKAKEKPRFQGAPEREKA